MSERVVITGLGVVTALGHGEKRLLHCLLNGCSGIRPLRGLDRSLYRSRNGAQVDDAELAKALTDRQIRAQDRTVDMAMLVAADALDDAGLLPNPETPPPPQPIATVFGTASGPAQSAYRAWTAYHEKGVKGVRPTTVPRCMFNAVSAQISMRFRLAGPNYVVVASCASSTVALGIGYRMIRDGHARQVLCGGAESMFDPGYYACWDALGVMSRADNPETCFRPFDTDRDGFVLGEGAGALVLESLESARTRGARIRAELCGYGESSDAEHITRPSLDGQTTAIRAALDSAGMHPRDIGFINAHGTATKANDLCESQSIRAVFGKPADTVPAVSSKSYFGHLIGAAGAVETVVTVLCLEAGRLHANLNLDHPDPLCNLCLDSSAAGDVRAPTAMKTSFGFGGNNGVLILRKAGEEE